MIGKIKTMAIITFYIAVLLVIAVYLQDGSGTFSHFSRMQIYIRNLRNIHVPAFHQTYDNYLQLFPLILIRTKIGRNKRSFRMETVVHFHSPVSHTDTAGSKRIKTHHRSASPGCHKLFLFSFRTYGSSIYGSYLIV